jgi:hypothetical protein
MKMKIIFLALITVVFAGSAFSQNSVEIENVRIPLLIQTEAGHPRFINSDEIIFSTPNYKGLFHYNLRNNEIKILSDDHGAGYKPLIRSDQFIFYRTYSISDGRKYFTLREYDLNGNVERILVSNSRTVKLPFQHMKKELMFVKDNSINTRSFAAVERDNNLEKAVYSEDNNLILIENGSKRIINPLGKGIYVWETLSPDGNYLLFTFGNKGSYICTYEGEILRNIPDAHYPRFSPDGKFISFMIDADDGEKYTASDIYLYSVENEKIFPVTNTENRIEMFAEWSPEGDKLIYHTSEGEIFMSLIRLTD